METGSPTDFFQKLDSLKVNSPLIHNIFANGHELKDISSRASTHFFYTPTSIFLLNQKHGQWDDILFAAQDEKSLYNGASKLVKRLDQPAKVSIIGLDENAQRWADIFTSAGFRLGRKIARMRNMQDEKELKKKIEESGKNEESLWEADFAKPGEEQAVLDLLLSAFDSRSDNLPELDDIRQNIEKKQVFVIRDQENVVACHYFTKVNNMAFGWYDVTAKKYRHQFLYFYMLKFQYKFWENEPEVKRSYSWRDANNKRILALAAQSSQVPDGIYIYNMIYG